MNQQLRFPKFPDPSKQWIRIRFAGFLEGEKDGFGWRCPNCNYSFFHAGPSTTLEPCTKCGFVSGRPAPLKPETVIDHRIPTTRRA
jgi:hypothetical protein